MSRWMWGTTRAHIQISLRNRPSISFSMRRSGKATASWAGTSAKWSSPRRSPACRRRKHRQTGINDPYSLRAYTVSKEDSETDKAFQLKIEGRTMFGLGANFDGAKGDYKFEAAKAEFQGPARFGRLVFGDS